MKDNIKKILSVLVVLCLCGSSFFYVQKMLEEKTARVKYESFFTQSDNFQVLFFGTSHVINAIFPMELWKDYGIISYNFGGHGNTLPASYWVMKNALDYTEPNVIVVDGSGLNNLAMAETNVHYSLDAFPISDTKVAGVNDLIESDMRWDFLWPYWTYHFRWNELTKADFKLEHSSQKGAEFRIRVNPYVEGREKLDRSDKYEEDTIGVEYLEKIIEECKSRDIDVLLTYLPFSASKAKQREANRIYDIAKEYGVNYLNFLDMDVINYYTDCYDSSHLNPSGARKVTDYLGQYLQENYNVPDQRENSVYSDWYEDYTAYEESKINIFKEQETLDTYLMLLADKNYNAVIEINNPDIWKAEQYLSLFENLGVDLSAISEETDFVVVQEGGKHADSMDNFRQNGSMAATSIGELSFFVVEVGDNTAETYGVYLNGGECYIVASEDEAERVDIRILVMDKDTLETVDYVTFRFTVSNQPEQNILSTIRRINP